MRGIPSSGAMDAAAGGRGPGTAVLPLLIGGEPQQIVAHLTQLIGHVQKITELMRKVSGTRDALRQAWPAGAASDGAAQKLKAVLDAFQSISALVTTLQTETQNAATAITMAQQTYRAVVGATNPTVASLLAQPHGHAAARALAVSATGSLTGAVQASRARLDTIGLVRIAAVVAQLATIADQLRTLLTKPD
ncbi:hypothetical protein J2S43_002581 [Catenuloplanes nepalensis]|uniref:Uncharacterized protein n=1 Tax=Catenuloplanes nepalensis TaxID=587533 RepID=A0ABT9MRL7_9ACTN|nr:hypothetical protein [Catenuloplanes nepalensis]MDP9794069.1 hypothetical protein [Catenuloplanes nepalensis]